MALIFQDGLDFLAGNMLTWEGIYGYNINFNFNTGQSRDGSAALAMQFDHNITGSSYAGPYLGTPSSPLQGRWLVWPTAFTVTDPTEIRVAFWMRLDNIPNSSDGTDNKAGRWWFFRLRDKDGNAGIALWADANSYTNGIQVSKFEANVGSQIRPTFTAANGVGRPWSGRWSDNQAHHIEMRFVSANGTNASGSVQVWIDREPVVNVSGVVTSNANTMNLTALTNFEFSAVPQVSTWIDDIVVWDSTGNTINSQIGPHRIRTFQPRANGTYTGQFTGVGNTGGNWGALTGSTDGDTSYVQGLTLGTKDSYRMTWSNSNVGIVHAVTVKSVVRNPDLGIKNFTHFVRSGGAESNLGRIFAANSAYGIVRYNFSTDPATNGAWTSTTINAFEVGTQVEN